MLTAIKDSIRLKKEAVFGNKNPEVYEMSEGYIDNTMTIYQMVSEFHMQFQHPIDEQPTSQLLRLRAKLIQEEAVEEGIKAVDERNYREIIDAMADFLYVGIGSMVAIEGGIINAISKFTEERSVGRFYDTTFIPGNTPLADMKIPFNEAKLAVQELNDIADRLEAGSVAFTSEVAISLRGALNRIYVACMMTYRLAEFMNIDIIALVEEVHRSNMSKLWPADDNVRRQLVAECKYDPADLGFRGAEGRDEKIGFRLSDGKILKSPTYSPACLDQFVDMFGVSSIKVAIDKM